MVKGLEEKGFLGRQAEPGDLRKFRLVLTDAGREALRRGREALSLALCRRLGRLEREDVVAFDRIVGRLAGHGKAPGAMAE
jgi:DNA-binding MarR family transcriptional regulator